MFRLNKMRYSKLSINSSLEKMDFDLRRYYGYGLYNFSVVLALINEGFSIYNPYYKDRKVRGAMFMSKESPGEIIERMKIIYDSMPCCHCEGFSPKQSRTRGDCRGRFAPSQ